MPESRHLPSLRWGERIETRLNGLINRFTRVFRISPHSGGGSGLKLRNDSMGTASRPGPISPHSGGGSGLKLQRSARFCGHVGFQISPHSGGGSGLKLLQLSAARCVRCHLPSLRWGERIETLRGAHRQCGKFISPHSGGGSGLKPGSIWPSAPTARISPHSGGGSGLKHPLPWDHTFPSSGSPLTPVGGAD